MDKEARGLDVKTVLNPKIWLIITALIHAVVGVMIELDMGNESQVIVSGWFLLTTVTMLYAAFCIEGEQQARLATVIAGPVWVWFIICTVQGYTLDYEGDTFTFEWGTSIPPLFIWGMTALSGIIHGNFQECFSKKE
tara:strand:+ start:81 stop:491 length:411 start_codon:yes stop_codon:yes gene_type:complete